MAPPPSQPIDRHRLATDTDDGLLLIISGPSGAGKTTITRAVERSIPGSVFSVSATTRSKAAADVDGVDYHFVDNDTFDRMLAENQFLETAEVFGNRYGTPRLWVDEQLARGRRVILEIDVVGARRVKTQIPDAFGLFILPPNEAALLSRLRARRREPEEVIQRRFAEARREIMTAREPLPGGAPVYSHFIVNDNLDRAIEEAVRAVRSELQRRANRR